MTDQILVPTDLTDSCTPALRYGAMLRDRLAASLTVLYADEPGYPVNMPDMPLAVHERPPKEKEEVLRIVRSHVEKVIPPPLPEIRSDFGFASDVIVKAADEIDANLIVMNTHARRGLTRFMLGSVTEGVLRETLRPVMTLSPDVAAEPAMLRTVLCPVNFSFVALDAMRQAAQFASKLDAELVVLYVAEEKQPPLDQKLETELASWVEPELRGRSRYRQMVATGNAADRVLAIAEEIHADLLVIGAQHSMFRDATVIGTTTERVVRFAKIPVLTVARDAES